MTFDYNTQRKKLRLPEYGRHIQKMIQYVKSIDNREKRNEQIRAVVAVMGNLNPHLRDIQDFRHKLWDHVALIADFDIDIDSPYPIPAPATFAEKPQSIPYPKTPVSIMHYGRHVENMLAAIIPLPEGGKKQEMIVSMANYMKKQYVTWNKDTVDDEVIFKDIALLSKGRLQVAPFRLASVSSDQSSANSNNSQQSYTNRRKDKKQWKYRKKQ